MKKLIKNFLTLKKKGSVLLTVIMFTAWISIIMGTVMKYATVEQRLNERHINLIQAQNAVESILEAGVAQCVNRWQTAVSFVGNQLKPGNSPLIIPSAYTTLYSGTPVNIASCKIQGGQIPSTIFTYVNPTDPKNVNDPLKGTNVLARNVPILASAQVATPPHSTYTVYAHQILQMRDAPVIAYAVFYNMDMEFHPGTQMDIWGPVHTNGNLYASAITNLYFHNAVSTSQGYYHRLAPGSTETPKTGSVWYPNAAGTFVNDYKGSGDPSLESSYYDSLTPNWTKIAANRWNGNLQSQDQNVSTQTITGFANYSLLPTSQQTYSEDALDPAYALIEPNMKVQGKLNNSAWKGTTTEAQKLEQRAGLIIRIYKSVIKPYSTAISIGGNYWASFHKLVRSNSSDPSSAPVLVSNAVQEVNIVVNSAYATSLVSASPYTQNSSGVPTGGMYDLRRGKGLDLINLDISKLRIGVDDTASGYKGNNSSTWVSGYNPKKDYNGIVYVEFPFPAGGSTRQDQIVLSNDGMGLQVINGGVTPNPTFTGNNPNIGPGFTLATNNTMYIKGSYNADGDSSTGSATDPDNSSSPEPPNLLAADSITILSSNWNIANSKNSSISSRPATFTEISAAVMSGIVPTGKAGTSVMSGGVHNFLRFLEDWSNITVTYRGSLVCLYESELANQGYSVNYYNAPNRNYGFYSQFADGIFPPATPTSRSFARQDFRFLSQTQYNTELASMNAGYQ